MLKFLEINNKFIVPKKFAISRNLGHNYVQIGKQFRKFINVSFTAP